MPRSGLHVLVVDDEEIVRNGLCKSECFPRSGYRVVGAAADGREALELTRQLKPDLVVTDINMPVMDGLSYLQALRQTGDDTAVLILSCYDDFHFAQRAIALEVVSYLLKPFTDRDLMEALERVKKLLEDRRRESYARQVEQFLLQGRESVLQDLLRQIVVRGRGEEVIRNIHHFGLMEEYPLYSLIFFRGLPQVSREMLPGLLPPPPFFCQVLDTADRDCLVLLCSRHVSTTSFVEEEHRLLAGWRQALGLSQEVTACGEPFFSLEQAHGQFLELLAKTEQSQLRRQAELEGTGEKTGNRTEIQNALTFIEERLCEEDLCLNMVAENSYISPFYFSRLFTQEMGMSFVRYVNTRRVERACILLRENRLRIYEVSKAVGFQNETYFHQVFKSIKEMTPKKYQRAQLSR